MYNCPLCGAPGGVEAACRGGADLTLLRTIAAIPDAWFNRGTVALEAGQTGRALEWVAAACVANPSDVAARVALARIWARLGHRREALDALDRAADLDPQFP